MCRIERSRSIFKILALRMILRNSRSTIHALKLLESLTTGKNGFYEQLHCYPKREHLGLSKEPGSSMRLLFVLAITIFLEFLISLVYQSGNKVLWIE